MQGLGEGLVIRQDVELPGVKHIPEMPEAEIGGEQLAIEGGVFQLRGIQLLAEEGGRRFIDVNTTASKN